MEAKIPRALALATACVRLWTPSFPFPGHYFDAAGVTGACRRDSVCVTGDCFALLPQEDTPLPWPGGRDTAKACRPALRKSPLGSIGEAQQAAQPVAREHWETAT
jgi:hypothetical protein